MLYSSVIQLYIYILFHMLFHYGLSQDIEYRSLCYTVGPCCLSILCIILGWPKSSFGFFCNILRENPNERFGQLSSLYLQSQIPNPSLPHSPSPLATTSLFSISLSLFLFCTCVHVCRILDSTCKWYMVFVVLFLTYFA